MREYSFVYYAQSPSETLLMGEVIGKRAQIGDVILLCGELGAGKTWITKGIAKGLDVPEKYPVTSPTFTFVNEYPGRISLYHIDLYRLEPNAEWSSLGLEEYLDPDGVTVIEWADKLPSFLFPAKFLKLDIFFDQKGRKIEFVTNIDHFGQIKDDLNLA